MFPLWVSIAFKMCCTEIKDKYHNLSLPSNLNIEKFCLCKFQVTIPESSSPNRSLPSIHARWKIATTIFGGPRQHIRHIPVFCYVRQVWCSKSFYGRRTFEVSVCWVSCGQSFWKNWGSRICSFIKLWKTKGDPCKKFLGVNKKQIGSELRLTPRIF